MLIGTIKKTEPLDKSSLKNCQERWDNLIKPINSLGILEQLSVRLAGILSCDHFCFLKSELILVATSDKKASDFKESFLAFLAEKQNTDIVLFNEDFKDCDITKQEDILRLIDKGAQFLEREVSEECNVICLSDVLGEGILKLDISLIKENVEPVDLLNNMGNFEIVIMIGIILKAAEKRTLIIIDSVAASIAALVATEICPLVKEFLFMPSKLDNPIYKLILQKLKIAPCLDFEFTKLNGTGGLLFLFLLKMSLNLSKNMKTFAETGVSTVENK
ncbi:nicotinate-nucleotide--dimethylbenzimidazole phosphoribosyltransferase [Selenomonadales bacterium OttesenSCG-928-I06]|nr:nicotinate-nucleotide--dimethylbenzimidazole phosphoribosyltransferase [Selenomonadales bacterium OttesenSCG-928-I06]